jgi:hypothetical protein
VAGGAFCASTEPAATIITPARITRLMNILPVGPDTPSFPSEELYSWSCNTLALDAVMGPPSEREAKAAVSR